jgi:hypothetical protein
VKDDRNKEDTWPPGDAVTAAERTRAEGFARLVEGLLAGEPMPPAMDSDDRALLEAATMVVASTQDVGLSAERSRALVDEAIEGALTGSRRLGTETPEDSEAGAGEPEETDIINLGRRRSDRLVRTLPWVVATVAAAAAILLFITRPKDLGEPARQAAAELDPAHFSRPADPLIGRIPRQKADQASSRLDAINADRLAGYRDLQLAGRAARAAPSGEKR